MIVDLISKVVCGCGILLVTCSTAGAQRDTVKTFGISSIGDEVALESEPSRIQGKKLPPTHVLVYRDGGASQDFPMVPLPRIRREYHGTYWLSDGDPRWSNDRRFLTFESEDGLCIVDTTTRVVLINHAFAGLTKYAEDDIWAAIRFRSVPRRGPDGLQKDHKDVLLFLKADVLAKRVGLSTDADPYGHVPQVNLDGIAVVRPIWSDDGTKVATAVYSNGDVKGVLYDVISLQEEMSVPLDGVSLTPEQAYCVGFWNEVELLMTTELAATPILEELKRRDRPMEGDRDPAD